MTVSLSVFAVVVSALSFLPAAVYAATAPNGSIAYTACAYDSDLGRDSCDIWVTGPNGNDPAPKNLTRTPDLDESDPTWSPDGSRLAFTRDLGSCNTNIWTINANGTGARQITYRDQPNTFACQLEPTWSPDGSQLAFLRTNPSTFVAEIVVIDVESGAERVISPPGGSGESFGALELAWSPDGAKLAFSAVREEMMEDPITGEPEPAAQYEIVTINLDGSGERIITAGAPGSRRAATLEEDRAPAWSPDGSQLVFMSQSQDPSCCGKWQVWVADRDGTQLTNLSNDPDLDETFPSWSPDGALIVFSRATGSGTDLFVMPAPSSPTTTARSPRALAQPITTVGNAVDASWGANRRGAARPKRLTVALRGNGSGSVSSNPAGLSCNGTARCRATFAPGTSITLTAVAEAGSSFAGWSGAACRDADGPSCTLTLDRTRFVRATFTR